MNRRKAIVALLSVLAAGALTGCPSTATTTGYTPITGIAIRSAELTAGFGCGEGPRQVYAYAALLSYSDDAGVPQAPVYSQVVDCPADGLLSNLPPSSSGSLSFDVTILAWNRASFPAALACFPPTPANPNATYPCPGDVVANVLASEGTNNWSTACTATQQAGVSVLAVCAPLSPSGGASGDGGGGDGGGGDGGGGDGGGSDAGDEAAGSD